MRILYLSYDGMTDPLGQSQVLPYLIGLSKEGHTFVLISFEKPDRFLTHQTTIRQICMANQIDWVPLRFSTGFSIASKLWDVSKMLRAAKVRCRRERFDLIHCRSYISAWVAVRIKRSLKVPFLFDMRGFWVDERVEGGLWSLDNPVYALAYRVCKKQELTLIKESAGLISLTIAAVREIDKWMKGMPHRPHIEVIPCSADIHHFTIPTAAQRTNARESLGFTANDLVVCYLGSVGTWYLLPEMIAFFKVVKEQQPNAKLFFITPGEEEMISGQFTAAGLNKSDLVIRQGERKEVPFLLGAADIGIMFIKTSFSKTASSPTKLGEMLCMGIPVIGNVGVGDVGDILSATSGGLTLEAFDQETYKKAAAKIPQLLKRDKNEVRQLAVDYYDLSKAVKQYNGMYRILTNG